MARLMFVIVLTVLTSLVASDKLDEANTIKHAIIKREALLTAEAIRKIVIRTPQDKVQIASMASDFMVGLNLAAYFMNNVVPNVDDKARKDLSNAAILMSDYANEIQHAAPEDSEQLREKLAAVLVKINESIIQFEKESTTVFNEFATSQLTRKHDVVLYVIYKLKYQALFFDKTNKELEPEMNTSLAKLTEALTSLTFFDKAAEEEFHYILQFLSTIAERCSYKLGNWVDVNPSRTDDIKLVQATSLTLNELFDKLRLLTSGSHNVLEMKSQFLIAYGIAIKLAITVTRIDYPDNLGGQEFLRSCLFDAITIGRAHADSIKSVLSKTQKLFVISDLKIIS